MNDILTPYPIQTILYKNNTSHPVWSPHPTLYLLLEGEAFFTINKIPQSLPPKQIQLINGYNIHEIHSQGLLLQISIDISFFERCLGQKLPHTFFCSAASETNRDIKITLKKTLAQYILAALDPVSQGLGAMSHAFCVMELLQKNFSLTQPTRQLPQKSLQYLTDALEYMNEQFDQIKSITQVSAHCHITDAYLSRLFKEYIGISITSYLEQIRLNQAQMILLGTHHTIKKIAQDCGFPSSRSFSDAFRKYFHMLPTEFRNRPPKKPTAVIEETLTIHLQELALSVPAKVNTQEIIQLPCITPSQTGTPVGKSFFHMLHIGPIKHLLSGKSQAILETFDMFKFQFAYISDLMQPEIIPHIHLSDEKILYNYSKINEAIDLLLAHKLRPFINLDTQCIFLNNQKHYSQKQEQQWKEQLIQLLLHLIKRYGISTLSTWRFTIFQYPYAPQQYFNKQGISTLIRFFSLAAQIFYDTAPELTLYPPEFCAPYSSALKSALKDFLEAHKITPPQALLYFVPPYFKDGYSFCGHPNYDELSILDECIQPLIYKYHLENVPIYVTKWTPFSTNTNYLSDTIATVPLLAQRYAMHHRHFCSIAYAPLSDYFDSFPRSEHEFYGYSGIFTRSGIGKPMYLLFWIICHFHGHILCQGDGYFVTQEQDMLHIVLFNPNGIYARYKIPDTLFSQFVLYENEKPQYFLNDIEKSLISNNRNAVYEGTSRIYRISFDNLDAPRYYLSINSITHSNGNPYQVLMDNGGENASRPRELVLLKDNNTIGWYHRFIFPQNGHYELEHRLAPNEFVDIFLSTKPF